MSQNDNIIQFQARLDQAKSKQNINADIKTLQKQIEPIKPQVTVDAKVSADSEKQLRQRISSALKEQFSQASQSILEQFSLSSGVTFLISKAKDAMTELMKVNTLLTEIQKTANQLSKSDLTKISSNAFDTANKYGKSAADYLTGLLAATRAGYADAAGIAELSVAAQSAGDMTAEMADEMIMAADQAYDLHGSVSELTKALDGMNHISDLNAVSMSELSEGMSLISSTAATFGVSIDEAAAALSAMMAATRQSGSDAAAALNAILLNIRQVTDEEAGIDAEGLARYEQACDALHVKLKETRNGILSLRDPMDVLRNLSAVYQTLGESDIRKINLLDSVGGGQTAELLDALLSQWSLYESMLQQYQDGSGSMAAEAAKMADSWEGSLNRLSNTWMETIGNLADSDAITAIINGLNGVLSVINNITGALGSFGTISTIGAGILGANGLGLTDYVTIMS